MVWWCMVRGVWCVVCVVRGAWCVVRGAWCVVRGAWCVVRGAWCVVCDVWSGFKIPSVRSSLLATSTATHHSPLTTRQIPRSRRKPVILADFR